MSFENILICSFEVYMMNDLGKNLLYLRDNSRRRILAYLCGTASLVLINSYNAPFLNLICVPLVYCLLAIICFGGRIFQRLCAALCYYMMIITPEFIISVLFSLNNQKDILLIVQNEFNSFILILLVKMATFVFVKCVVQIHKKRNYENLSNRAFFSLLVLPVSTMILLVGMFYADIHVGVQNKIFLVIGAALLLISNAYMFYLLDELCSHIEKARKIEMLYAKSSLENLHLHQIEKVNESHRVLLHDINKYIRTAAELLMKGNIKESLGVFEELDVKIKDISYVPYCSHKILNAILCERKVKAQERGIEYSVELSSDLVLNFISDIDLISIVGNLLDNALEAASKIEDGEVRIHMFMANDGHFMLLEVKNNFMDPPVMGRKGYITNKKEKEKHGIGIHTVENIVKLHNGKLDINICQNVFTASIIFQI